MPRLLTCVGRPLVRLALVVVCVAFACATAQGSPQFRFDNWTTDDGLPQNTVNDIFQSSNGYLWLATFDGLVRYDGIRFVVFNKANSEGIVTNRFTHVREDSGGVLWFTAETDVLTRYANGRFESFAGYGIPTSGASIEPDGALGMRIFTVDTVGHWRDGRFVEDTAASNGRPFIEHVGRSGTRWRVTRDGLHAIRDDGVTSFPLQLDLASIYNMRLHEDRTGALWVATTDKRLAVLRNGVLTYFGEKEGFPKDYVAAMLEDRNGGLWCATQHEGLVRIADGAITVYTKANGLPDDQLLSIFEVGSSRVDLQACKLEYSIVSPK